MKKRGVVQKNISNLTRRFWVLGILAACEVWLLPQAVADTSSPAPDCFNFDTVVTQPLRARPPGKPGPNDITASGKLKIPEGTFWGSAVGQVKLPIQNVYQLLLDHYTIKDPEKVKLKIYSQERKGYQDFHVVMLSYKTPIISVNWEEEWAYAITEGTATAPKKVVISYQKTTGTKFVSHFCGSIVLSSLGPKLSEVYLYEEINAFGKRTPEETVKGHIGTLNTLRKHVK